MDSSSRGEDRDDEKEQISRTRKTIREPLIIYRDILIPLMRTSGFALEFDQSDDTRYHTRFVWRTSTVETDVRSPAYGQKRLRESKIDVIGIPMGHSFLILHAIVIGDIYDVYDDVRLKIRCAPRANSLSIDSPSPSSPSPSSSSSSKYVLAADSRNSSSIDIETSDEYRARIRRQLQTDFVYKLIEMFSIKLDDLPVELKLEIMSWLPLKTIVSLSRVSTAWRELALDEQLWRLMVQKFFPQIFQRRERGQSWKALFKDEFRRQRLLEKRRAFSASRSSRLPFLPALPSSPPLLPIMPPPYMPMLPPPPTYIRDLLHPDHHLASFYPYRPPLWRDDHQL